MKKMSLSKIQEIIIVHTINRLKEKIRPRQNTNVYFTENDIAQAQNALDGAKGFKEQEEKLLIQNLLSLWSQMKELPTKNNHLLTMFIIYINRLDDLSSIFSAEVIQDFVASLKKFLQKVDIENKSHRVIIQAHLDVINLAHHHKIEASQSEDAANLKRMLDLAIQQNSPIAA